MHPRETGKRSRAEREEEGDRQRKNHRHTQRDAHTLSHTCTHKESHQATDGHFNVSRTERDTHRHRGREGRGNRKKRCHIGRYKFGVQEGTWLRAAYLIRRSHQA